jgi:hypothetical protein
LVNKDRRASAAGSVVPAEPDDREVAVRKKLRLRRQKGREQTEGRKKELFHSVSFHLVLLFQFNFQVVGWPICPGR